MRKNQDSYLKAKELLLERAEEALRMRGGDKQEQKRDVLDAQAEVDQTNQDITDAIAKWIEVHGAEPEGMGGGPEEMDEDDEDDDSEESSS